MNYLLDGPSALDQLTADLVDTATGAGIPTEIVWNLLAILRPTPDTRNNIAVIEMAGLVLSHSKYEYSESNRSQIEQFSRLCFAYGEHMRAKKRSLKQPQFFGVGYTQGALKTNPIWTTLLLLADVRRDVKPEAMLLMGAAFAAQYRAAHKADLPRGEFIYEGCAGVRQAQEQLLNTGSSSLAELHRWIKREREANPADHHLRAMNRLVMYARGQEVIIHHRDGQSSRRRHTASTLGTIALIQERGIRVHSFISRSDLRALSPTTRGAPDEILNSNKPATGEVSMRSSGCFTFSEMRRKRAAAAWREIRFNRVDPLCRSL